MLAAVVGAETVHSLLHEPLDPKLRSGTSDKKKKLSKAISKPSVLTFE